MKNLVDCHQTAFIEGMSSKIKKTNAKIVDTSQIDVDSLVLELKLESYYAVYFDEDFYIGRIIGVEKHEQELFYEIKYLQKNLDKFTWPKKNDIRKVKRRYIFYGPIPLKGNNPFEIPIFINNEIKQKYKTLKRSLLSL